MGCVLISFLFFLSSLYKLVTFLALACLASVSFLHSEEFLKMVAFFGHIPDYSTALKDRNLK